jgi:glucose/mannose-6-phosphate isomerase
MELDGEEIYQSYDPDDVGSGIENLPEQVRIAWHDTREIVIPRGYAEVSNIVIAGMGGSALGPYMLKNAFYERLNVPVELVRDYTLPGYVDRNTLVILSSFSGTTEEIVSAAEQAREAKAKVMVIAAGGTLIDMAREMGWPAYVFEPGEYAKQPRYGVGFSLIGLAGLLERAGILKIKETELEGMIAAMADVIDNCAVDVPGEENPAKQVAESLQGKNIFVIAAEHLAGNANTLNNQINENAKQLSHYLLLPELNHHFLEGLRFPEDVAADSIVFLMKSSHYHPRTQKRCDITAGVFEEKGIPVIEYDCRGETRIEEMGEVLQFGSYVAWYLAMLNHVVTTDIAVVDGFKKKMNE